MQNRVNCSNHHREPNPLQLRHALVTMRLLIAALPGLLRSFAPTPRRHLLRLKSVEDVHGDDVLATPEELSTP